MAERDDRYQSWKTTGEIKSVKSVGPGTDALDLRHLIPLPQASPGAHLILL